MAGPEPLSSAGSEPRQSRRFLALYTLAAAGGSVAYVPFLTLLLPTRVTAMAGAGDVGVLAYLAFAGAVAASVANIAFGWLSDRSSDRRGWILAGLIGSGASLVAMALPQDPLALVALVIVWQIALNMMLAPLSAWAGDCVPDAQKGLLGGLLAFCPALGALAGVVITKPGLAGPDARLWLVAGMVAAMILPVLLFGKPRPMPQLRAAAPTVAREERPRPLLASMWLARLLVQIAEAALFAYILFWFRSVDPSFIDNRVATLFGAVLAVSVPVALAAGTWSDRRARPILPLAVAAFCACGGLLLMSAATGLATAIAAYAVFGLASSVFLALHSAQTLRVLPRPRNRGRDLGVFNLTNTVPSLIMPWLALGVVPAFGFSGLFLLLSALALTAAILLVRLSRL